MAAFEEACSEHTDPDCEKKRMMSGVCRAVHALRLPAPDQRKASAGKRPNGTDANVILGLVQVWLSKPVTRRREHTTVHSYSETRCQPTVEDREDIHMKTVFAYVIPVKNFQSKNDPMQLHFQ